MFFSIDCGFLRHMSPTYLFGKYICACACTKEILEYAFVATIIEHMNKFSLDTFVY